MSDVTFPDEFGTPVVGLCFPENLPQTNKDIKMGRKARPALSGSVTLVASSAKISIFGAVFLQLTVTVTEIAK